VEVILSACQRLEAIANQKVRDLEKDLAAIKPQPIIEEHAPVTLHNEGARVSFSHFPIANEHISIGARRKVKLHRKIAR
jgi:hypothetical protein